KHWERTEANVGVVCMAPVLKDLCSEAAKDELWRKQIQPWLKYQKRPVADAEARAYYLDYFFYGGIEVKYDNLEWALKNHQDFEGAHPGEINNMRWLNAFAYGIALYLWLIPLVLAAFVGAVWWGIWKLFVSVCGAAFTALVG